MATDMLVLDVQNVPFIIVTSSSYNIPQKNEHSSTRKTEVQGPTFLDKLNTGQCSSKNFSDGH